MFAPDQAGRVSNLYSLCVVSAFVCRVRDGAIDLEGWTERGMASIARRCGISLFPARVGISVSWTRKIKLHLQSHFVFFSASEYSIRRRSNWCQPRPARAQGLSEEEEGSIRIKKKRKHDEEEED